jgi:hypothetical protein
MRHGRNGRPLYPGDDGAHPAAVRSTSGIRRFPAAQSLTSARYCFPSTRTFKMTRHQPRVHSRSPARPSPSPVAPGRNEDPSAYTPGSAPRSYPQRTPGRGPAFEHGPEITSPSAPPTT